MDHPNEQAEVIEYNVLTPPKYMAKMVAFDCASKTARIRDLCDRVLHTDPTLTDTPDTLAKAILAILDSNALINKGSEEDGHGTEEAPESAH